MRGIGPELGALTPLSFAAASAALIVVFICVLAVRAPRTETVASVARVVIVVLGAVLCGSLTWAFFVSAAVRDHDAERRTLELRAGQLTAQSLIPGSPLACLDILAGDVVANACEKTVFASPAAVASAISFVAARFVLLADMTDYRQRVGSDIDSAMLPLRRELEADPYGFLARVLTMRDGCTAENCQALKLLHDASHVRTNLIAQTLDHFLEQYRVAWAKLPDVPEADMVDAQPTAAADPNPPGRRKVMVNIDFPTAASIPPISIMNPEPKEPADPRTAAGTPDPQHKRAAPAPAADGARPDPVWVPAPAQAKQ
jgi:hypothetical protein